jgi:hypothetical protein
MVRQTFGQFQRLALGFTTPQDVNFHLNYTKSRFLRELDFAKFHHYGLIGLHDTITELKKDGGNVFQGSSFIRVYKKFKIFSPFKIETKIVSWDESSIFLDQTIKTLSGNVCFNVLSKQRFTKVNVVDLMEKFTSNRTPEQPEELKLWLQSMQISSSKLRGVS